MKEEEQDILIEDLLSIPPLVHRVIRRKLLKAAANVREDISPPLFGIMKILDEAGTLHIAEIGDRLQLPRPQMTHLIDKLVEMEIVGRQTCADDRRIINVSLTSNGQRVLEEFLKAVRGSIKMDLSCLTDRDLQELSFSLRKLSEILLKFQ
jgi:MarR family 2-MHQ and catechol resistance regulon transcriptional repressor